MNTIHYRNTLVAAAVAATLSVGAAGCSNSPDDHSSTAQSGSTASQPLSDTAITTQVRARLASDSSITNASDINVTTVNGVVTLEGSVRDAAASSAAERTARAVTGVASVSNRLNTSSGTRTSMRTGADSAQDTASDSWITTKVKSSLLADSDAKGFDVSVETNNGIVTLEGELENQAAVDHVRNIAAGIEGVRSVNTTALRVEGQPVGGQR